MEDTSLPAYFGEWLKHRRKKLDLTQAELAQRAGCSLPALRKIETGERRPSKQLAGLLARALEVSPEDQTTFMKVARGELNVERLRMPGSARADRAVGQKTPNLGVNLPFQPTPFIGRETELAALGKLLADPQCRLLTIKGLGGIGKTRLAIEAASANQQLFPDGVIFVDFSALSSPTFIVYAIIDALDLKLAGPQEPQNQLISALREKKLLLVLDNIEHLLDDVGLFTEMLKSADSLKLLVTSRERLNLQGEWVFDVQGLAVPTDNPAEHVEQFSSVKLFVQRAQQTQAEFKLGPEERPWVVRICRIVEGIPLGIELAAAWVRLLSCEEIAREIEANLDFLAANMRNMPQRQRSLRATFDYSWKLLSSEERLGLMRLAIFRGGFLHDAAQQVALTSLHILLSLVDKSLLKRSADGRYYLHELLRQYASEKLEESSEELLSDRDRHCNYYMNFVSDLVPDLKSDNQLEAIRKISAEIDNIRTAWRVAVSKHQAELIRKPITGFWLFYDTLGWIKEGEATFRWAAGELDRRIGPGGNVDPEMVTVREHINTFRSFFLICMSKLEEARVLLQRCFDVLQGLEAWLELEDVYNALGLVELISDNYTRSRELFLKELELATRSSDPWNEAFAYYNLGLLSRDLGEYREADQFFQKAIAIHQRIGDQRRMAMNYLFLGDVERVLGKYQEAKIHLQESLELSKTLGDIWAYGMALSQLGVNTRDLGEYTEAVRLLREGLALLREMNECGGELQTLNGLGSTLLELEDYAEARFAFVEAMNIGVAKKYIPETLESLVGLVDLLTNTGHYGKAGRILENILEHPAMNRETRERAECLHNEIAAHLTFQERNTAHLWAQNKTLNEVIGEVLQENTDLS